MTTQQELDQEQQQQQQGETCSISLGTTVGGVRLTSCVYNASGPRTGSYAALCKIGTSSSGCILTKSATVKPQTGNPLPRTWHDTDKKIGSLNSEGLPNSGIEYYIDPETIRQSVGDTGKPYMVSISGHTLEDNLKMLAMIASASSSSSSSKGGDGEEEEGEEAASGKGTAKPIISAVELNLACPNVIGKPIIAYDFDQMHDVLDSVSKLPCVKDGTLPPLGVKLPPYFDGPHFDRAAAMLNEHKSVVRYVASINTIGNAFAIDVVSEMPVISSKGGFAGLSGSAVKYTALANVRKLRTLLDPDIDVVGVGGIETGEDAFAMILCGASAVQIGTVHWTEGPTCFNRICDELRAIMAEKGYKTVNDFRGKIKPWSKEGAAIARAAKKAREGAGGGNKEGNGAGAVKIAKSDVGDQFMIVSAILAVVVAVLLADKFGIVSI